MAGAPHDLDRLWRWRATSAPRLRARPRPRAWRRGGGRRARGPGCGTVGTTVDRALAERRRVGHRHRGVGGGGRTGRPPAPRRRTCGCAGRPSRPRRASPRRARRAQCFPASGVRRPRAAVAPDRDEPLPPGGGAGHRYVAELDPASPLGAKADHGGVPDGGGRRPERVDIAQPRAPPPAALVDPAVHPAAHGWIGPGRGAANGRRAVAPCDRPGRKPGRRPPDPSRRKPRRRRLGVRSVSVRRLLRCVGCVAGLPTATDGDRKLAGRPDLGERCRPSRGNSVLMVRLPGRCGGGRLVPGEPRPAR